MGISGCINVGVFLGRRIAKASHLADRWFIQLFPKRARPHEGFIVKARGEKHTQPVIYRTKIAL